MKKINKQGQTRIKFDTEKLTDPMIAGDFNAIGGQFGPLTILDADDTDMDILIDNFNTAVIETSSKRLGKYQTVLKDRC